MALACVKPRKAPPLWFTVFNTVTVNGGRDVMDCLFNTVTVNGGRDVMDGLLGIVYQPFSSLCGK